MWFLAASTFVARLGGAFAFLVSAGLVAAQDAPLRVAVYDAPPYGHLEPDGSIDGVSVDLWRRAAEVLRRDYRLIPVSQMETILEGLERNEYDAALGAITITPARLARVDFSYSDASFGGRGRGPPGHGTHGRLGQLRRGRRPAWAAHCAHLRAPHCHGGRHVARRAADAASQPRIGRRYSPRRRLLGGRDDDDGRLRRQDAQDSCRTRHRDSLDAGQRRADFDPVDLDRLPNDRRTHGGRTSRYGSRSCRQADRRGRALVWG